MDLMRRSFPALLTALALSLAAAGCAKNVDRVEFRKWGHSFDRPPGGMPEGTNIDTSAQGGASVGVGPLPESTNYKLPKASVGGSYHRTFATSPSYRLMGGFHVTPGQ
jgi:hypothetical protein